MSSQVPPTIAVIGFSNVAYRTACRLAAGGTRVLLVLTRGEIAQLTPLPAGIESMPVPHLNPGSLPALGECQAAVVATEDEQLNLHLLMHLNVTYPGLRIVTRFFNLALGREIEARLPNVSVLSVSDLAAPVFVARAFADTVLSAWREQGELRARVQGPAGEETLTLRVQSAVSRFLGRQGRGQRKSLHRRPDLLLLGVLGALLGVVTAGTLYFTRLHGFRPEDALYFVITTLTTTGYGDYSLKDYPFSAKLAGMAIMLSGGSLFAILFALLTDKLFRMRLDALLGMRRVRKRGHMVLCGAGDVGIRMLECLMMTGADTVVIERNPDGRFNQRVRELGVPLIISDITLQETLERAGVPRASTIFCATDSDMGNLEAALNARALNPEIRIVVRAYDRDFAEHMRSHFGIDAALSSSAIAAESFAAAALAQ